MTQNSLLILTVFMIAMIYAGIVYAQHRNAEGTIKPPIVVELFTSQSCSSCPPADKILSKLAEQDHIIALGCHVSYWDHLHWKDTFSHDFCDIRQRGYSRVQKERGVYTPQMVVNGTYSFVGSHKRKVTTALKKAQNAPLHSLHITRSEDQETITFSLPEIKQGTYRLWAYGYQKQIQQDIGSGENRGKSVAYTNPVSSDTDLGRWDGTAATQSFQIPNAPLDGIAILAQENDYGRIIAAGKLVF